MQSISDWTGNFHHGDCIDLMNQLPTGSVDLVVTSPPYNILLTTGGGFSNTPSIWPNAALRKGYEGHSDKMEYGAYVEWQRACLDAMLDVVKEDGAIFYNHKWRVQGGLIQDRAEIVEGFPVRQIIIWQRAGGMMFGRSFFTPTYEVIYLIAKRGFLLDEGKSKMGDVWSFPQELKNPHPASYPIELPRRCIDATDAGIVLDPFMGSGSTAIAAQICGRKWIGFDNSEEYCRMARDRISRYHGVDPSGRQGSLFQIKEDLERI